MHLRKYLINETYFDTISSEDKAYVLGFIYADGCIISSGKRNYFSIELQLIDRSILDDFSKLFCYNSESMVKCRTRYRKINNKIRVEKSCRLTIYSVKLVGKLCDMGCLPRKSLTVNWVHWMSDVEMQRHFIRGYFDGDGCLKLPDKKSAGIDIVGTYDFCTGMQSSVNKQIKIKSNIRSDKNSPVFRFEISGNKNVKIFLDWLYDDSSIF